MKFLSLVAFAATSSSSDAVASSVARRNGNEHIELTKELTKENRMVSSSKQGEEPRPRNMLLTRRSRSRIASQAQIQAAAEAQMQSQMEAMTKMSTQNTESNVPNYIPQIPGAVVQIPTLQPQTQPELDAIQDMQPFDTLIGDSIQKRFVKPPSQDQPPTQAAIDLAYGCAATVLPSTVMIQAPNGCSSAGRSGLIKNGTSHPLLTWQESCLEKGIFTDWSFGGNIVLQDNASGEKITEVRTRASLFANVIDITDCNGNPMYVIHEALYKLNNMKMESCHKNWWDTSKTCLGESYLQYSIATKTGKPIAVSPYVSIFANEFALYDATTGKKFVSMTKNGAWSPLDKCPEFEKIWYALFESSAGLGAPDKRWVITAFISIISLRDDDRNKNNASVRLTTCQNQAFAVSLILIGVIIFLVIVFSYLARKLHWKQHLITFFFRIENQYMPKTMVKSSKFWM